MLRSQISSETDRSPHILEGQKVKKGCFLKEWQETQWKTMKNYCFWRVSWLNDAKCIVSSFRELILWFGPSPSSRITRIVLCGRNFPPTNVVGLNTLSHWSRIHLGASQKLDEVGYTIVLMDPRWLFFLSETWTIWAMVITRGGIDQLAEFLCQFFPAHRRKILVKAPHGTRWTRHFRIILGFIMAYP